MPKFPLDYDINSKVPYMFVDNATTDDRNKYFNEKKRPKLAGGGIPIRDYVSLTNDDLYSFLSKYMNDPDLDYKEDDIIRFYFGVMDPKGGTEVPSGLGNNLTLVIAPAKRKPGSDTWYDEAFYTIDPVKEGNLINSPISFKRAQKWIKINFQDKYLSLLDGTFDDRISPSDTKNIRHYFLGLAQLYREIQYQNAFNRRTISGLRIYFSSYTDTATPDDEKIIPQRMIIQFVFVETAATGEETEYPFVKGTRDQEDYPHFEVEHPIFDTGSICPPKCNGATFS